MKTRYHVDDVDLDDDNWRWKLSNATRLPAAPAQRTSRLEIPRLNGVKTRRGGWGSGSLKLALFIPKEGVNGITESIEKRVTILQSLLARAKTVYRISPGLPEAGANIIATQVSEPQPSDRGWNLEATIELQPFWFESALVTSAGKVIPGEVTFLEWAGTTGDVVDGILRVKGPASRVEITGTDGRGVSFESALTASQYVFVDLLAFTAWRGGAAQWSPNTSPVLLDYPAAGPLALSPSLGGVSVSVAGLGLTAASELRLRGHRFWL